MTREHPPATDRFLTRDEVIARAKAREEPEPPKPYQTVPMLIGPGETYTLDGEVIENKSGRTIEVRWVGP